MRAESLASFFDSFKLSVSREIALAPHRLNSLSDDPTVANDYRTNRWVALLKRDAR
jgi:hypothetical protein